jgi:hypothetical protein
MGKRPDGGRGTAVDTVDQGLVVGVMGGWVSAAASFSSWASSWWWFVACKNCAVKGLIVVDDQLGC